MGVLLGLVKELQASAASLVEVGRCFVFAALYELIEQPRDKRWSPKESSTLPTGTEAKLVVKVRSARFSPRAWQEAYEQRQKALDELKSLATKRDDFSAILSNTQGLENGWTRVNERLGQWSVHGRLDAGEALGELLAEVLNLLLHVKDRKQAVELVPQLMLWALALERGRAAASAAAQSGGAGGIGSVGAAPPRAKPTPSTPRAPRSGGPSDKPDKPDAPKAPRERAKPLPKGPPNPNAKARGTPETDPHASSAKRRDLDRQNDSADRLAREGYDIEHNKEVKANGRAPDYKISGEYADHVNVRSDNVDQARTSISKKVRPPTQADRIVARLDDTSLSAEDVQGVLERKPVKGLKEVIFIKDDVVTSYVP